MTASSLLRPTSETSLRDSCLKIRLRKLILNFGLLITNSLLVVFTYLLHVHFFYYFRIISWLLCIIQLWLQYQKINHLKKLPSYCTLLRFVNFSLEIWWWLRFDTLLNKQYNDDDDDDDDDDFRWTTSTPPWWLSLQSWYKQRRREMKRVGFCEVLRGIQAIFARLLFLVHSVFAIWGATCVTGRNDLWALAVLCALFILETIYSIVKRRGREPKWYDVICC